MISDFIRFLILVHCHSRGLPVHASTVVCVAKSPNQPVPSLPKVFGRCRARLGLATSPFSGFAACIFARDDCSFGFLVYRL